MFLILNQYTALSVVSFLVGAVRYNKYCKYIFSRKAPLINIRVDTTQRTRKARDYGLFLFVFKCFQKRIKCYCTVKSSSLPAFL